MKKNKQLGVSLLVIIVFSIVLIIPNLLTNGFIYGIDAGFHFNRFYDTMSQIKEQNFQYFISMYGFNGSGRIINALYSPYLAYFNGLLLLIGKSWFNYQLLSNVTINIIAGSSMFYLLRTNKITYKTSTLLSMLFMVTYPTLSWGYSQGFSSWGNALLPIGVAACTRMLRDPDDGIHVLELTFGVGLLIQTHILSSLFLICLLVGTFLYAFVKTTKKLDLFLKGVLSACLVVGLSANILGAMLKVYSGNNILSPHKGLSSFLSSTLTPQTGYMNLMSPVIIFIVLCHLVFILKNWKKITLINKYMTVCLLVLFVLSTNYFPWHMLLKIFPSILIIQFPSRFAALAIIMTLLCLGLDSEIERDNSLKGTEVIQIVVISVLGMSTIGMSLELYRSSHIWKTDRLVMRTSNIQILEKDKAKVREMAFEPDGLEPMLHAITKPTPDYVPIAKDDGWDNKDFHGYASYSRDIIHNDLPVQKSVEDGQLVLRWNQNNSDDIKVPIIVYKDTVLTLNGSELKEKDYYLSDIGALRLKNNKTIKTNNNELKISYKNSFWFSYFLGLSIVGWLSISTYGVFILVKNYNKKKQQLS